MVFQAVIVPACLLIASALPKILSSRGGERFIKAVSKSSLAAGFDLIGELLALKALADFDRRTEVMGWKHPDLIESPGYRMEAKGLRHPLLELKGTSVVPNDVKIDAGTPTVITGINSGGKSTLVTSIFLNQLLLQNGLRIPVDSASVAIADRLHYRGPLFNGLDEEGRYGAELKDTKTALTSSTRRSLVIFDEICGGTSDNERLDISYAVIEAMRTMEISTLLVTHDRVLAQRLADNNLAKPITFGLGETGDPDYIVRDGIGKSSYADRIARKLQFTPSDIRRYAEENRV
jgi:DNA mismatch repair ATPase MutS